MGLEAQTKPQILFGRVMHARLLPKRNAFRYGIYYMACPLDRLATLNDGWRFGVERFGLHSFYRRDHGDRQGGDLRAWLDTILQEHDMTQADGEVTLVTMPRVLGYVFNPVSFWLCHDRAGDLRAVLCEVNNTFGESHTYLCVHDDRRVIGPKDWLHGDKMFHVSPFLPRDGGYKFRFAWQDGKLHFNVDHYTPDGELQLATLLEGGLAPATRANWRRAFWRYPLVTMQAVFLIHWQALRLLVKGIRYVPKPSQHAGRLTKTGGITKS